MPQKEGFTPLLVHIHFLNRVNLETLGEWIKKILDKGFIRASALPAGAPCKVVWKFLGLQRM